MIYLSLHIHVNSSRPGPVEISQMQNYFSGFKMNIFQKKGETKHGFSSNEKIIHKNWKLSAFQSKLFLKMSQNCHKYYGENF
jgi:hypothetical protein